MSDFKPDTGLQETARAMHRSLCITFGTTAPYRFGAIRLRKIGFASIPRLCVPVQVRRVDLDAIIPLARQRAFAFLAEKGISDEHLGFQAHWNSESYRERLFVDENETSASYGKRKRGIEGEVHFDLSRMLAGAVDWRASYDGRLPERWEL